MIIPFLTPEEFQQKFFLSIILQVIIMVCMIHFAQRQATDYDNRYMRRWRIITGMSWIVLAFTQFFMVNRFSLPLYYYATYGTTTPTDIMLSSGVSTYMTLPGVTWGNMTYKQWLIESNVTNALRYISLGWYFILYKPSSVKWWVKVRKFIGYAVLIYVLPATFNFHYFSIDEFEFVALAIVIVYLLTRTYKHDAILPTPKEAPIAHDGTPIEDFVPIEPSEVVTVEDDNHNHSVDDATPKEIAPREEKQKSQRVKTPKLSHKGFLIILCVINILLFLSTVIIVTLGEKANQYDYKHGYSYDEDWGVYYDFEKCSKFRKEHPLGWGYKYVDNNLGTPIHANYSLYYRNYWKEGQTGVISAGGDTTPPMYVRFLNYKATDHGGKPLFGYLMDEGYPCMYKASTDSSHYPQIIYWDKIDDWIRYEYNGETRSADYWIRKHIIQEKDNMVYEKIVYMLDDKIYDESIENVFLIECPYDSKVPISPKSYRILYIVFSFLSFGCSIIILMLFSRMVHGSNSVKNIRAFRLFQYMVICQMVEYFIHILVVWSYIEQDSSIETMVMLAIIALYFLLIRLPLLIYVYKVSLKENSKYYLVPKWLFSFIKSYSSSEAPIRTCVAFILYPIFYLCIFPCGLVFLSYVIPAIIIFVIALFILWTLDGRKKTIE